MELAYFKPIIMYNELIHFIVFTLIYRQEIVFTLIYAFIEADKLSTTIKKQVVTSR